MATIANAKDSLTGMVHSTSLTKVRNLNELFRRAAINLLSKVDPPGTIRISQITNAVHSEIYDYSAADDLKGDKLIDLRPQINRLLSDRMRQRFIEPFDLRKKENTFVIRYDSGEKSLRLSKSISPSAIVIHQLDSITANGTWAVGGDGDNLTQDTLNKIVGSASLNFDLDGSSTEGYIENSDMDEVDLSDEEDIGKIFVRVYLPNPSAITSITLRWGSSSSAYWSVTVTSPHDQDSFKTGWNILAFDWNGATETGSPDSSAIDYLRVTITYEGTADTDFRVDRIACSVGEIWEMVYYSKYLFRTSGGTWQETTSDDSDIINLDIEGYNLFLNECLKLIAQQIQGEDSGFDIEFSEKELKELYRIYKKDNPSQAIKKQDFYYRMR